MDVKWSPHKVPLSNLFYQLSHQLWDLVCVPEDVPGGENVLDGGETSLLIDRGILAKVFVICTSPSKQEDNWLVLTSGF